MGHESDILYPLFYQKQYRLLVCTLCKTACVQNEVQSHLHAQHKNINAARRRSITQAALEYKDVIATQSEISSIPVPEKTQPALEWLQPPRTNGIRCKICGFITTSNRVIREHCKTEHNWVNPRQPGGQRGRGRLQPNTDPWERNITHQRFFTSRAGSRWFEVEHRDTPPDMPQFISAVFENAAEQTNLFKTEPLGVVEPYIDKEGPNAWLARTGWAEYFAGISKEKLIQLRDEVTDKEILAYTIIQSTERVIQEAEVASTRQNVGLAGMFEAARTESQNKPKMPLAENHDAKTTTKYIRHVQKIVASIVRIHTSNTIQKRLIVFTTGQQMCWDSLCAEVEQYTRALEGGRNDYQSVDTWCRRWLQSLIEHPLNRQDLENGFLAGLGATAIKDQGDWERVQESTQRMSALIRAMRVLTIHTCLLERQELVRGLMDTQSEEDAEREAPSMFELLRQRFRQFMVRVNEEAQPSPMDWLLETRAYGFKVTFTTPTDGAVWWEGQTLHINQITLHMSTLSNMLHNMINEARQTLLLATYCDHITELPTISWNNITDDINRDIIGYSFLTDTRNTWITDKDKWMLYRVDQDKRLKKKWLEAHRFRERTWNSWVVDADRLRGLLLLLMHMTSMPARGTEIISLRFRNTANGGLRNIIILDRMVAFVTAYHKGFRQSGRTKIIHRFLPREVGELLVWYLWLILPFRQSVEAIQKGAPYQRFETSPFLWSRLITQPITTEETNDPAIGSTQNTQAHWPADRIRMLLTEVSERLLGQPILPSEWRHMVKAIARRYLDQSTTAIFTSHSYLDGTEADESDEDGAGYDNPLDLQFGHSSYVGGLVYGREIAFGRDGIASQIQQFRDVSISWHTLLGLQGVEPNGPTLGKRKHTLVETARADERKSRFEGFRRTHLAPHVKALLGPFAELRGMQQPVLEAIQTGQSPILYIAGTGEGKSIAFMLPAFCTPGGVTIVIAPLIALERDIERKCRQKGISCAVWEKSAPNRIASIVVVTPEAAVSPTFNHFAQQLLHRGDLDRVVIDESHVVLDATPYISNAKVGFRPTLLELKKPLAQWGVQTILLTATLSPGNDQKRLLECLGILSGTEQVFRGITRRRNIQYKVLHIKPGPIVNEEEDRLVLQLTQGITQGRVLIYCDRQKRAEDLAQKIGCRAFHADIASPAAKTAIYMNWAAESGAHMVATSALSLGIDVCDIRLVIICGLPHTMREFIQQTGRAGRDGLPAQAIILCPKALPRNHTQAPADCAPILELIQGDKCRRITIDRYMDGITSRRTCEPGERPCDICDPKKDPILATQAKRALPQHQQADTTRTETYAPTSSDFRVLEQKNHQRAIITRAVAAETASAADELHRRIADWFRGCIYCRAMGIVGHDAHTDEQCPQKDKDHHQRFLQLVAELKKRLVTDRHMESYTGCFMCQLPFSMCGQYEPIQGKRNQFARKYGESCTYPGVVLKVYCAMGACREDGFQQIIMMAEQMEQGVGNPGVTWLGKKRNFVGRLDASNIVHMVLKILRVFEISERK